MVCTLTNGSHDPSELWLHDSSWPRLNPVGHVIKNKKRGHNDDDVKESDLPQWWRCSVFWKNHEDGCAYCTHIRGQLSSVPVQKSSKIHVERSSVSILWCSLSSITILLI